MGKSGMKKAAIAPSREESKVAGSRGAYNR